MVAALTRVFGMQNLELAEDVVQDAFCRALEVWKLRGVPNNPRAWLMKTARNRALDVLRRERTARTFAPEYGRLLHTEWTASQAVREVFDSTDVPDDQLRMMFSCCTGSLPEAAQVMLVLALVGGFGVREIAAAFVSPHAAVEKRLSRAKRTLKECGPLFDVADAADFANRLPAVQRALYLIFSEGYHGASATEVVRADLCHEAIRLTSLSRGASVGYNAVHPSAPRAHVSRRRRLAGRLDPSGNLTSLFDQDRTRWDRAMIAQGIAWLEHSATGSALTRYHVEAAIAAVHASAPSIETTDWAAIVALYDMLMRIAPSPIVALNRAIAVAQVDGAQRGLEAIDAIAQRQRLEAYPFYYAARAELELRRQNDAVARQHFERALAFARNSIEQRFFENRLATLAAQPSPT